MATESLFGNPSSVTSRKQNVMLQVLPESSDSNLTRTQRLQPFGNTLQVLEDATGVAAIQSIVDSIL